MFLVKERGERRVGRCVLGEGKGREESGAGVFLVKEGRERRVGRCVPGEGREREESGEVCSW